MRNRDTKHAGIARQARRKPLREGPLAGRSRELRALQGSRDVPVEMEVRYAINRIARVVQDGERRAWDEVKLRSYDGRLVGPVLEARPGDTLSINLRNRLPCWPEPDPDPGDPNTPHGFNTTNLHFHGLHVSPAGNADNMLLAIEPGRSFQYEVKIPPDHPAGTFYYHPHKHGSATLQMASGMVGALVIRGDIDRVPAIRAAREQIIVFQQIPYVLTDDPYEPGRKANMVESYALFGPGFWRTNKRRFTLNGVIEPTFTMRPGEVQRWRFIHAGIREMLKLKLVRREGDQEVAIPLYQIAHDGITTGRIEAAEETELHPGYRVDVMVRAGDAEGRPLAPGSYWLVDEAAVPEARNLARVVVRGQRLRMRLPTEQALAPLAPFQDISDDEITGTQQVIFSVDLSDPAHPRFLINGRSFDPNAPPRPLTLGAVEAWHLQSLNFSHPFHIHTNPFQVELNGRRYWKDTVIVSAGQPLVVRTRYRRYVGTTTFHCHILEHQERGMAELARILPPDAECHPHPPR